jgi:hypothetical protein
LRYGSGHRNLQPMLDLKRTERDKAQPIEAQMEAMALAS